MAIVKQVKGHVVCLGGEEHEGRLPAGAAQALPNCGRTVVGDRTIDKEAESLYLLMYKAPDFGDSWDFWFESLVEAERSAEDWFGIGPDDWDLETR
jgi:hypothetical protein